MNYLIIRFKLSNLIYINPQFLQTIYPDFVGKYSYFLIMSVSVYIKSIIISLPVVEIGKLCNIII